MKKGTVGETDKWTVSLCCQNARLDGAEWFRSSQNFKGNER